MPYGLYIQPEWGHYPKVDPLDGFDGPISALNPVNDGGPGWSGRTGGVPVDGTHFPKRMRCLNSRGRPLPDFDEQLALNVSARAKQVIETVEPGVHQFFGVDYLNTANAPLESRFWLVVCNRIDAMAREHTNMVLLRGQVWRPADYMVSRGEPIPAHLDPTERPRLVFSLSAIGNAHLWVDRHIDGPATWLSDAMAARFAEANLTGLRLDQSRVEAV